MGLLTREHLVRDSLGIEYLKPRLGDSGQRGSTPYSYMLVPWIEGSPLGAIFRSTDPSELANLTRIAFEMSAKALEELHIQSTSHGDLQPDHFLLEGTDRAFIIDLGLAQGPKLPRLDYRGGLVHFMSPEVAQVVATGDVAVASTRGDVFSLAATFHYLVAGRLHFDYASHGAETWAEKVRVISEGQPSIDRDSLRLLDTKLAEVLEACLNVDPALRPYDASEVLRQLSCAP